MNTDFIIKALDYDAFSDYFEMNDNLLSELGLLRMKVDEKPGFPCRVSLMDAEIGEEVILINYLHHDTASPYRATGPVFVRKDAKKAQPVLNEIPEFLNHRLLSLRIYDSHGMMINARVVEGSEIRARLYEFFENTETSYIHIHNAGPGCYNCVAERASA